MNIIEAKNLSKNYGSLVALDSVDLNVKQGEVFGLLGPNGAGKTTLLEILETLRIPDSGEALVNGFSLYQEKEKIKQSIGVQLQFESFFDHLTLSELLLFFAQIYEVEIEPLKLLTEVDLVSKAEAHFDELSGGQKRRFSLAVAIINEPKILFLDEPTTGLDPQARRNVWEMIKRISARGITIVLTTHYLEEAEILCDRIAIMDEGKIIALGTMAELVKLLPHKSILTFVPEKYIPQGDLERLAGVRSVQRENGFYRLESTDPQASLYRLLQMAYESGNNLSDFDLYQPNLEEVFLHLTGKTLRE